MEMDNLVYRSGWLPAEIDIDGVRPLVKWLDFSQTPISHPFFSQTIESVRAQSAIPADSTTELGQIVEYARGLESPTPSGFIFHISRCGSTLIANCMRNAHTLVLSEAPALTGSLLPYTTGVWRISARVWERSSRELVESIVRLFSHHAHTLNQDKLIIKFASWTIMSWQLVRSIWPRVPCIVVIRSPSEVIQSNLSGPSGLAAIRENPLIAGGFWPAFGYGVLGMGREEYYARAIGAMCETALLLTSQGCRVVDYGQLTPECVTEIADYFGLSSGSDPEPCRRVFEAYAKDSTGQRPFRAEDDRWKLSVSEKVRIVSKKWSDEPYASLKRRCSFAGEANG